MFTDHDGSLLNDAQRRHLEVVFAMIERGIEDLERLAAETTDEEAHLRLVSADMPVGTVPAFQRSFARVRQTIAGAAKDLGLHQRHESRRRWAQAVLLAMIIRLEDTYAGKLRGYGEVSRGLPDILDPAVDAVKQALEEAHAAVSGSTE